LRRWRRLVLSNILLTKAQSYYFSIRIIKTLIMVFFNGKSVKVETDNL
jgi:hypothetical protein